MVVGQCFVSPSRRYSFSILPVKHIVISNVGRIIEIAISTLIPVLNTFHLPDASYLIKL